MSSQPAPAQMRDLIVERLTGETGNPEHVLDTARACAARCMPDITAYFEDTLKTPIEIELGDIEICRTVDVRLPEDSFGAMMTVSAEISPDALFMTLDAEAIAVTVSALFGADPKQTVAPITRALSEIEVEIAGRIFEAVAQVFNGSGDRSFGMSCATDRRRESRSSSCSAITGADSPWRCRSASCCRCAAMRRRRPRRRPACGARDSTTR
jgi:flagellar motor switch protein FliM